VRKARGRTPRRKKRRAICLRYSAANRMTLFPPAAAAAIRLPVDVAAAKARRSRRIAAAGPHAARCRRKTVRGTMPRSLPTRFPARSPPRAPSDRGPRYSGGASLAAIERSDAALPKDVYDIVRGVEA
jgi:hypothetical protein